MSEFVTHNTVGIVITSVTLGIFLLVAGIAFMVSNRKRLNVLSFHTLSAGAVALVVFPFATHIIT